MEKFVYSFNEGSKEMRNLMGGKGANLAEMTRIGLPVPFGFTVTTEACNKYYEEGGTIDEDIIGQIHEKMAELENVTGKAFGDEENPLLVSVRSGSVFSMPGMMDTILNLGLNDKTVVSLAKLTANKRFAYDSYRRFIHMYGNVVMNIPDSEFNEVFDSRKREVGAHFDVDLSADDLEVIICGYKEVFRKCTGSDFPQEPEVQLIESVKAVFRSWNNDRAKLYRKLNNIPDNLGTAVNIQSMVFGNMGNTSCTGVAFTRNPATGVNELFGEFLVNAQGEDVVAGIRTPRPIEDMEELFPEVYKDFERIAHVLETHYNDIQDMEFTVENNKLYMLQTRVAKRTAVAAVKIAVDMVDDEIITKETAVSRIDPATIPQLIYPEFVDEEESNAEVLAVGLPASPGAASGRICFNTEEAEAFAADGEPAILVREETSPEDLAGMVVAEGIVTARGGMTSHAAVVARGMGKCCIAGCQDIDVNEERGTMSVGEQVFRKGDFISLNGTIGTVYEGQLKTYVREFSPDFRMILSWADEERNLDIRANADNAEEAELALSFGAEGIGLCRTEHMFFSNERIPAIRQMIMAEDQKERDCALRRLMPFQKSDFKEIFDVMEEKPVTIRLLDPPLHEFLPHTPEEMEEMSEEMGISIEKIERITEELTEFNPMLGNRGCRLAVTYPEIAAMQTRAIIEAAIEVSEEKSIDIVPEIMIPLVGTDKEFQFVKSIVDETAKECIEDYEVKMEYKVGTMIEIPRAALTADRIAKDADFFSFGTNDLTQMTFGLSRDDTGDIISEYVEKGIYEADPFQSIDVDSVGRLMEHAVEAGKEVRPSLKLGICGEHGGDPKSIAFCNDIGLDYVSCSPYRIPVARIAAAQAAIWEKQDVK